MTCKRYADVVVPGPWWNALTYLVDDGLLPASAEGARVKVPLGKGTRVGFIMDADRPAPDSDKGLKRITEVLDDGPVIGRELWDLAGWIGSAFLCGMGEALQLICPPQILRGGPVQATPVQAGTGPFRETLFYNPIDEERFARYCETLSAEDKRTLVLFPEVKTAGVFFARLSKMSERLKEISLLWPSAGGKKLWDAWKRTASGGARIVVGSSAAVFAPFCFDEVIVDDESNPAYIFQRAPKISARSIAGRRAMTLNASLVLGGRMPSAKTYMRSQPQCRGAPKRNSLVFVDVRRPFKNARNEVRGVEGELPITSSLLERTESVLTQGRSALWIMDRKGHAGEVYCSDCGASLCCPRCKGPARSEGAGANITLRCLRCGLSSPLPPRCPVCRGILLLGKRPGLDSLLPLAARLMKGREVILDDSNRNVKSGKDNAKYSNRPSLILGTRRLLSLCDSLDAGLVAWLDLDAEARKADYNARFQAFSMVWESCWRGLRKDGERAVLMQVRGAGNAWRSALRLGWDHFWKGELREREQLSLPPYGLLVQIDLPKNENRKTLIDSLERESIIVMDSGEEDSPLWVMVKSTGKLKAALAPRFEISRSRAGFPVVTVFTE